MTIDKRKKLTTNLSKNYLNQPICEKSDYTKKLEKTIKSLKEIIKQLEIELERKRK